MGSMDEVHSDKYRKPLEHRYCLIVHLFSCSGKTHQQSQDGVPFLENRGVYDPLKKLKATPSCDWKMSPKVCSLALRSSELSQGETPRLEKHRLIG